MARVQAAAAAPAPPSDLVRVPKSPAGSFFGPTASERPLGVRRPRPASDATVAALTSRTAHTTSNPNLCRRDPLRRFATLARAAWPQAPAQQRTQLEQLVPRARRNAAGAAHDGCWVSGRRHRIRSRRKTTTVRSIGVAIFWVLDSSVGYQAPSATSVQRCSLRARETLSECRFASGRNK